jgi:hypothetical protein
LQFANIALHAEGYRAAGEGQHYWTFQSLANTLNYDADLVSIFDKFRKKRNITDYQQAGIITAKEVDEIIKLTKKLRKHVTDWLQREHPELV